MRIDQFLTQIGEVDSRNKAAWLIKEGFVFVGGKMVDKPSFEVDEGCDVMVKEYKNYVGRGALKLLHFLESTKLCVKDLEVLDIGSSTGGFTEVLLEYGAKEITAVDVGSEQLHKSLLENNKVKSFENTDIRNFISEKKFDLIVCDVSFTGIENILSSIDRLAKDKIIILFKPQFEVGKNAKRDKKGVVKDEVAILKAIDNFNLKTAALGWKQIVAEDSKISGKEGNVERFFYFTKY